jgi:hypothetical protein
MLSVFNNFLLLLHFCHFIFVVLNFAILILSRFLLFFHILVDFGQE